MDDQNTMKEVRGKDTPGFKNGCSASPRSPPSSSSPLLFRHDNYRLERHAHVTIPKQRHPSEQINGQEETPRQATHLGGGRSLSSLFPTPRCGGVFVQQAALPKEGPYKKPSNRGGGGGRRHSDTCVSFPQTNKLQQQQRQPAQQPNVKLFFFPPAGEEANNERATRPSARRAKSTVLEKSD